MKDIDPALERVIDHAKAVGTYKQIDRSKQYHGRYNSETLLRNDNLLFERLRRHENLQLRNHILVMGVAALLARLPEIYAWIARLMQ